MGMLVIRIMLLIRSWRKLDFRETRWIRLASYSSSKIQIGFFAQSDGNIAIPCAAPFCVMGLSEMC